MTDEAFSSTLPVRAAKGAQFRIQKVNAYLVKAPLVSATYSACAASNKMDIRKKGSAESHVEDIVKHRRGMRTSNSLPSLAPSGVAGASLSFRPSSPPSPPPSLQSSQLCNNPRVTSTGHAPVMHHVLTTSACLKEWSTDSHASSMM